MEARKTRDILNSYPPDLGFVSNPLDPLHQFIDVIGRDIQIADEYIRKQLFNINPVTADPTEPSIYYTSGNAVPLGAILNGNWMEDINDIASMEVTGFDYVETLYPGDVPDPLYGISYSQDPDHSGWISVTASGNRHIYHYMMEDLSTPISSGLVGVVEQNFDDGQEDEYLIIQRDTEYGTIAQLKHTPAGEVVLIDTKHAEIPWAPDYSDGLIVPSGDISLSGDVLLLANPRPSYNPPSASGDIVTYPADYQPDLDWNSSFIAEYIWYSHEEPYGICQPTVRHELGLKSDALVAMKALE